MDENTPTPEPPQPIRAIVLAWLNTLKKVFLVALVIAALVGASFVFTGRFSAQSFSDRLFATGIIVTTIGVFIFITVGGMRRNLGIPAVPKTPEDARKVIEGMPELRARTEQRYDAGSQVWIVGLACMVLSIVIYYMLSVFGI